MLITPLHLEATLSMPTSSWKSITIPLAWGKLSGLSYGEGPTVLCLHGWLDNAASFVPLVPLLPKGNRYVAIDMAGHGHSDHRPAGTFYHYFDYLSDLVEVLDVLKVDDVSLLSHSLGGTIASVFSATFPERVRRLVLLESLGPLTRKPEEAPERLRRYLSATRKLRLAPTSRYATLDEAVAARRRASPLSEPAARLLVERNAMVDVAGVRWRSDRRLLLPWPTSLTEEQAMAFLSSIHCPTLLVRAEPGYEVPEGLWERRKSAIADLKMVTVAGDHHVHMDAPAEVATHVAPFLAG